MTKNTARALTAAATAAIVNNSPPPVPSPGIRNGVLLAISTASPSSTAKNGAATCGTLPLRSYSNESTESAWVARSLQGSVRSSFQSLCCHRRP